MSKGSPFQQPRCIVILGSTGSIGTQSIDVIKRNRDRFQVKAISAGGGNIEILAQQAIELGVEFVGIAEGGDERKLQEALQREARGRVTSAGSIPEIVCGAEASAQLASLPCDGVLNGITGSVGLAPTLAALRAGNRLILANKESLIVGGSLITELTAPDQILPVDSEHSALFQCLQGNKNQDVRRLVITASGGPFRERSRKEMTDVTPDQALAHPVWNMGPVITVNSANLVNKGLEVIEAHLLFDIPFDRIEVVVHPQAMVHSMVEYRDGSTMAQVSPPDIRIALALGMSWPDRLPDAAPGCDWSKASTWEFFPVDHSAFPGLGLACEAGAAGGTAPAAFNAANEECVKAFLSGRITFLGIVDTIEQVMNGLDHLCANEMTIEAVLATETWARRRARELMSRR